MGLYMAQFKALVLMMIIVGSSAKECRCEDHYEISFWRAALCGVGAVVAAPVALTAAGFTAAGVAAGSAAAAVQAGIGSVAAGSAFAAAQSAGAAGIGLGGGAGIAATAGALCGVTYKKCDCD